jgi:hypothetical protein
LCHGIRIAISATRRRLRCGTNAITSDRDARISRNVTGTRPAYTATMLRLKPRQRAVAVEKLPDLANVILGVLVIGQFVDDAPVSIWLVGAGFAAWVALAGLTLFIAGGEP